MSSLIGFVLIIVIIVNVCMKIAGVIDWSWWLVFWPLVLDVVLSILLFVKHAVEKWCDDMMY